MKRPSKYSPKTSIRDLFNDTEPGLYTRQTMVTIFRCFLETIIENRYPSVILAGLKNAKALQGLFNRLKYTESKVYIYSDDIEIDIKEFNHVKTNHPGLENDEFLVIIAERFTACLYLNEAESDVFGLCEGFCSLNPSDVKLITDFLQEVAYDENIEKDLSNILQDRRNNEKFTTILRKLVTNLESRQRDLICADTELKDLCQKTAQAEKFAFNDELISTMAHELRNPLGMIGLHAAILSKHIEKSEIKDTEIRESVLNSTNAINNASQNLEKLLTELIDYSKPMKLEKTESDIQKALSEVINLIQPGFDKYNVNLSFENRIKDNYKILFDKAKIHQAVLNIIKNALEVSEPGDNVKVILDYSRINNSVCIKISDEGPGISAQNKTKIFTPFFTTKKNGTGLGLVQSGKIAEAHGGSLLIDSTDIKNTKNRKGTTFEMTLPTESVYTKSHQETGREQLWI